MFKLEVIHLKGKKPFSIVKSAIVISTIITILQNIESFEVLQYLDGIDTAPVIIMGIITQAIFSWFGNFVTWLFVFFGIKVVTVVAKGRTKSVEVGKLNGTPIKVNTPEGVHVARGGVEDASYRKVTGQTLAQDGCNDCTDKDPWEVPTPDRFKPKFKLFDSPDTGDDVEAYYKERESKRKGR